MSELPATATFTAEHRGGEGSPMVLLHGFTDTWRCWEPMLGRLEAEHDVLAPTLAGHAGGPPLPDGVDPDVAIVDALEAAMDAAGFETAHLVGNSLGGYAALQLAGRRRARSVTALAPAGGWPIGDPAIEETLDYFRRSQEMLAQALPHADAIVASPEGRKIATEMYASTAEHLSPELIIHQMRGAHECPGAEQMIAFGADAGWNLDAERIDCPVRLVWGDGDRILVLPAAAERFRTAWIPQAEWVELDGAGHCPQLDHPLETAQLILDFTH
jgi:pimeloyl-ACP methyl ester carboxylesterase